MKKSCFLFFILFFLSFSGFSGNLYWVGNSGNWNNNAHWAETSGGQPGASVPGSADDAIFDENSFDTFNQKIVINGTASCKTILFTNDVLYPILSGNSDSHLNIYGSISLSGFLKNEFEGDIYFKSNSEKNTINLSDHKLNSNIYFKGAGTWELKNHLLTGTDKSIYFNAGTLYTNSNYIRAHSFEFTGSTEKTLWLNSSVIILETQPDFSSVKLPENKARIKVNNSANGASRAACTITGFTVNIVNPKCNTTCDGSVTVTSVQGDCPGPFTYNLQGDSKNLNGSPFLNLCNSTYILTITDSTGSSFSDFVIVNAPPPIANQTFNLTQPTCNGYCNGSVKSNIIGGTTPYSYSWSTSPVQTTAKATNLCAGTYTVTVTDANLCTKAFIAILGQPALVVPNLTFSNISCFGACDGSISSSPSGGNGTNYTYSWTTTPVKTTSSISSLCPGKYVVTVKDDSLCIGKDSVTLTQPTALVITPSSTNVTCGGAKDGKASVSPVTGGTTPYTFTWTGVTATGATITGLSPGTYSVTVKDANNCTKTASFTITEPPILVAGVTGTNITCFNTCNGTATSKPTGGTKPYTYTWSNGQTATAVDSSKITGLCPGTFTVTVRDANNCTATQSVTLTQPAKLNANATTINITCNELCNGEALSNPSGGTTPYTYLWNTSPTNTNQNITGLCVGSYKVVVTDGQNCKDSMTVNIIEPPKLTVTVADDTISCGSACDGALTAVANGGISSAYSYSWSNSQTTQTISGLCAISQLTVTVRDANGCTANATAFVRNPTTISPNVTKTDVTCNGVCNGTATSNPTGGSGPYTFSWSTAPVQTTQKATGLCANVTYTVTVRDALGCTRTQSIILTEPIAISSVYNTTNVTCFGLCTGASSVTLSGGTPSYSVSWINLATNTSAGTGLTASSLCAGRYVAVITDNNSCIKRDTINITQPNPVSGNTTFRNVTCNAACNGSATANPTGGTPSYSFLWNNAGSSTTATIAGLCPGTYIVTITDNNNCTDKDTIIITQPDTLNATIGNVNASCDLICDGSATIIVGGGTPPYTYLWNNGQTKATATNLCVGNYSVTVSDSAGCNITLPVTILPVVKISINPAGTLISCPGACDGQATAIASGGSAPYTYVWNTVPAQSSDVVTGLCAGTYTVTATDVNGCASKDSVPFTNPAPITFNTNSNAATCGNICDGSASATFISGGQLPYSFIWSNGATTSSITNLCAGAYTITVSDSKGCTKTASVTITSPSTLAENAVVTSATCNTSNGQIVIAPSGGVSPYTIKWLTGPTASDPLTSTSTTLSNIPAGVYTVEIVDAIFCRDTFDIILNNVNGPTIVTSATPTKCFGSCDGKITATPSGGSGGYTFLWNDPAAQTTATATNLCKGNYIVTVTDNIGCKGSIENTVTEPSVIIPNVSITDITCSGFCDGAISLSPSGGTSPYSFLWTGGQTTQNVSGLCSDTFTVTISDANLCAVTGSFIVKSKTVLQANLSITDVNCNGACNGIAGTNVSGGTSPYTYLWAPSSATTPSLANLCAGSFSVTIKDQKGCTISQPFEITEPGPLGATITTNNILCNGNCNGSITSFASGGSGSYKYFWTPGGQTSASIINQCAGNDTLIISDPLAPGCSVTFRLSITEPPKIKLSASGTNLKCNNVCDGTLTSSATGGTGTLVYQWKPGALLGSDQAGICAGTYKVTVTDANSCSDSATVIVTEPPAILSNLLKTNVTCNSLCDGSATITPSGGSSPYSVLWLPGNLTTNSITGLCAGTYSVIITDSKGCSRSQSFAINEPNLITATTSSTDATCGICDGSGSLTPSGGTGVNYSLNWLTNGSTTSTVTGLCAGLYPVLVVDSLGCSDTVYVPVNNVNGPFLSLNSTDALCDGSCDGTANVTITGASPFSILWTPTGKTTAAVSNLCAGLYFVQVIDSLSCLSIDTVRINESSPVTSTPIVTNVSCTGNCDGIIDLNPIGGTPGYTFSWSNSATTEDITNLCTGTYTVTITDSKLCTGDTTLTIIVPNPLLSTKTSTNITCNGAKNGIARVNITGGTAPYTVTWSTAQVFTTTGTSIISGLAPGSYTASITDANGCTSSQSFNITEPAALTLASDIKNISCNGLCDGRIIVTPGGGSFPYQLLWNDGSTNDTLGNICGAGTYNVTLTDANGCVLGPQSFQITEPAILTVSAKGYDITCNNSCNGAAKANVFGGTSPYFYQWNPTGYTTDSIFDLCPGAYTVNIIDNSGCSASGLINITEPTQIIANETIVSPPCSGNNGQISLAPSGGAGGPYVFQWAHGPVTAIVTGLTAGIYTVTITDVSGCSKTFDIPVSNINGPVVVSNVKDVSCSGSCNGSIKLTVSGATSPYTFSWSPGGATTDSIGSLCPGIYIVQVTDAINCISFKKDTIDNASPIEARAVTTSTSCDSCNGGITLNTIGGTAPYNFIWTNGSTSSSLSGLCAGVHSVQITDSLGCRITENINVSSTGIAGIGVTATDVSCFGSNDGTASITPLGGNSPYTYLWVPGGNTTPTITGLEAGVYSAEVMDVNGCIKVASVTINGPSQIKANESVTNTSSCITCDGAIALSPTGGSGGYTFLWNTGVTTSSINSLCANIYKVKITDSKGCSDSASIAVNTANAPSVTISSTNITCNGNCNGTASVTATGGAGGFTYLWSNSATTDNISNLCPASYLVQVKDINGCAASASVEITEPPPFSFSLPNINDATCSSSCNGSATVLPVGGTLPFSYSWSPSGATTQKADNLCTGINSVSVTDLNGCKVSQSIIINETLNLKTSFTTTNATCGSCDGAATVNASGGTSPYTYIWASGATSASASNLCAGVHAVTILDSAGCSGTLNIPVMNTSAPSVALNPTNATCEGSNDGSIISAVSGGTSPYTYLWVPAGQTTTAVNNLSAGTYNLEVKDANGCIGISSATITAATIINVVPLITNASCGSNNGSVILLVSGGVPNYNYSWSGGLPNSGSQSGLASGLYTVTITDAAGICSKTITIPVSNTTGPLLSIAGTNVSCNGRCDGTATATVLSGTLLTWNTVPSQTTTTINNLCPGTYFVVADSANCKSINSVTINEPDTFHFSIPFTQNLTCGGACDGTASVMPVGGTLGYSYTWSGGQNTQTTNTLCVGTSTVIVTDAKGCSASQSVILTEPVELLIDSATIPATCSNTPNGSVNITVTQGRAPFTYSWSNGATTEDISNVLPGIYTITVADSAGCTKTLAVTVNSLQIISADGGNDTSYCEGNGPVTLRASGTGTFSWYMLPDNSTAISNTDSVIVNPPAGITSYLLQTQIGGCVAFDTIFVTVNKNPLIDAGTNVSILINSQTIIGGTPSVPGNVAFTWTPVDGLISSLSQNPVASPQVTTKYYLTATDSFGCVSIDSVTITIIPEIFIPNGLTLNNDGSNDIWIIDNIELFPNCTVEVYNRWGELLFSSPGYRTKWDGTYNGKELPVGTYYYIIDLKDERYKPFTGPITIMR